MRCLSTALTLGKAVADVEWHAPLEIRQREVDPPVATVSGAQQRKERLVLIDGQQLSVAQRPAFRRKAEGEYPDLAKEWF